MRQDARWGRTIPDNSEFLRDRGALQDLQALLSRELTPEEAVQVSAPYKPQESITVRHTGSTPFRPHLSKILAAVASQDEHVPRIGGERDEFVTPPDTPEAADDTWAPEPPRAHTARPHTYSAPQHPRADASRDARIFLWINDGAHCSVASTVCAPARKKSVSTRHLD